MKTWFIATCCCLLSMANSALAQSNDGSEKSSASTDYSNVSGSPYLLKDWCDGIIRFSSGRVMKQFKLKFDCVKNQLLLQFNGTTFGAESKVNEFEMYPKGNRKDTLLFRKGFPAADQANAETFYQVLTTGKATLLKQIYMNIIEEKQVVTSTGSLSRRYEEVKNYYLFRDGAMNRINDERKALAELLNDSTGEINKFIADNQLRMRTEDDYLKVVKKYNQLTE
jgi:hypothetical protein